jgi:hypothetical protein
VVGNLPLPTFLAHSTIIIIKEATPSGAAELFLLLSVPGRGLEPLSPA